MKEIESYKVVWDTRSHAGTLMLHVGDSVTQITMNNPTECILLTDILRNEKPVYVQDGVIFTGFEPVGEGEEGSADK